MRSVRLATWLVATPLLALAAPARGQDVRPAVQTPPGGAVHRMEIYNGPARMVHYFTNSASPGEHASLAALERAENEAAYVRDLLGLRHRYVRDDGALDARRLVVQQRLYGLSVNGASFGYQNGTSGYPAGAYPYVFGYAGYNGASYGYGTSRAVTESLANGIGDEGVLKTELARVIAAQATPEYAATVARYQDAVLAQAARSDTLRAGLRLPDNKVRPAALEARAVVTLKGGDKLEGTLVHEDNDWVTLDTGKKEVMVRTSEVVRVERDKAR